MKSQFYRSMYVFAGLVLMLLVAACQGPPGPQGPPGTPAARALAAVNSDGTLLRGVNVASVERVDTGRYRVTFESNVNVANGYYLVTPGLTSTCNMVGQAEKSTGNSVWVSFADHRSNGVTFADCSFSLVIF
jgi:hypothetical protein